MAGNAALLIDLENFYIGREQTHNRTRARPDDVYDFPVDLDSLCAFAKDIAAGRRLIVQRAYANFNDRRPGEGEKRWEYYLQPQPRFLMEQGIEPVQVFRFPGGNNKNAADMKMAMDATALLQPPSGVDLFVIITGDSDFIPLVLELKRAGAQVIVIGVAGCTKAIFERYCDRFEYFEDLLAARELKPGAVGDLDGVRSALHALVAKTTPIKFAAVKPLLSDQIGVRFDPTRFGCESTGDFLRKHADALGIAVRRGEHDWEIVSAADSPGAEQSAPAPLAAARTVSAATSTSEDADAPEQDGSQDDGDDAATASPDGLDDGDDAHADDEDSSDGGSATVESPRVRRADDAPRRAATSESRTAEPHTAQLYRDLLRQGIPRCYVVAYDDWNAIVDAVYSVVAPLEGKPPPRILQQELLADVTEQCSRQGMVDAVRKARDVCFQLFKAGCFHCAEDGVEAGQTDFHWSKKAMLAPQVETVDMLVERAWLFLAQLLARRLEQRGMITAVQIDPLIELFAGDEPTPEDVDMINGIVDRLRRAG